MKTVFLITAFLILFISDGKSQYIGDVPLHEIQSEYIEVTSGGTMLRKGINAFIDYGQESEPYTNKDHLLTDNHGRPMEFKSNIHVLNFMLEQGYELAEIYVIPSETSGSAYFVLRKKKT